MASDPNENSEGRKTRFSRRGLLKSLASFGLTLQGDLLFRVAQARAQSVGRPITIIDLQGEHPGVPTMMPDGRTVVSVNQVSSNLSLVDSYNNTLIGTIELSGRREPWEIAFTKDGSQGIVTHSSFDTDHQTPSFVTVVDMVERRETMQIPVGARPNGVAVDNTGKYALVCNMGSNSVSVIEVGQHKVVKEIPVGRSPFDVAFTPDNIAIVVNFYDASLSFIDMSRLESFDTLQIGTPALNDPYPEFGAGDSVQIAVNSWNGDAYVTNYRTHGLVVVDTTLRRIKSTIRTIPYPFGVAAWEASNLVSVLSGESRSIGIIDLGSSDHLVERFGGLDPIVRESELQVATASANTQIEIIPLGRGDGKPPLRLPSTRARDMKLMYVDPLRGLMYVLPPDPTSDTRRVLFGANGASRVHSGA